MHNLQGHTTSNPSTLSQWAAYGVTRDRAATFTQHVNQFLEGQLEVALRIISEIQGVTHAPPEGAFYIYLNVANKLNRHFRDVFIEDVNGLTELLLTRADSAVVPGSAFGDKNGIRLSYALEPTELVAGLEKIKFILNEID
jgi:aspartate aminotransferase